MLKLSYLAVSHNSSSPARWLYEVVQNIIVGMQPTCQKTYRMMYVMYMMYARYIFQQLLFKKGPSGSYCSLSLSVYLNEQQWPDCAQGFLHACTLVDNILQPPSSLGGGAWELDMYRKHFCISIIVTILQNRYSGSVVQYTILQYSIVQYSIVQCYYIADSHISEQSQPVGPVLYLSSSELCFPKAYFKNFTYVQIALIF